jgi:cation-transporting P-type ATPase C
MAHDRKIEIRVCHAVPGRVRMMIPKRRFSKGLEEALKTRLLNRTHIRSAEIRPVTGSLIVRYSQESMSRVDLLQTVQESLKEVLQRPFKALAEPRPIPRAKRRNGKPSRALGYYLINGILLSAFMGFLLIRRVIYRSSLSQHPLSFTGVGAMFGVIPLLWHAIGDLRRKKRIGLFPFLSAAALMAVFTGEALAALEILWVLSLGMLLEEYAAERARNSIRELLEVAPDKTLVLRGNAEMETASRDLQMGDTVVVHAGMKIPVDGTVLRGEALVDTSQITGRARPRLCRAKTLVFAGTRVQQGTIFVRADKLGEETFLARIRHLVETSLSQPTEMEKRADILAARLTKLGLGATLFTLLFTRSFSRAFSVMLVMACPCATVLAASTAIAAAIANAARHHILIKGGAHLERIPAIDTICFDKTGTLTTEKPSVTAIVPRAPRQDPNRVLRLAAGAEWHAVHPVAETLKAEARRRDLEPARPDDTEVFLGRGVLALFGEDTVMVGNGAFLESKGVKVNYFQKRAAAFRSMGQSVLYVARNGRLQGLIAVDNTPRPELSAALDGLRSRGASALVLISGDSEPVVRNMALAYDFDDYGGDLLPQEKSSLVKGMVKKGKNVMMVGDGVNDALVLSHATVGVAMGAHGSEVAVEAADITLMKSDLKDLLFIHDLAEQTLGIVEQNFWLATLTNVLGIMLAIPGWMPPVLSGSLHVGHSLGILMNSGRLLKWEPSYERQHQAPPTSNKMQ